MSDDDMLTAVMCLLIGVLIIVWNAAGFLYAVGACFVVFGLLGVVEYHMKR